MNERLSVGSLFSGIGGIELGFERAEGFETKWFVEWDLYCQFILKKHWPTAQVYDDVAKVDFRAVPKVDVLTGGFPCQDISNAGKRAGIIKGRRSSYWKYFCRAIRIIRPKYALIENVAALTQRGLNVVLADLAKIGYDAEAYNISASAVGAPHQRERIFILAYSNRRRHIHRQAQEQPTEGGKYAQREPVASCTDVENSVSNRLAERRSQGTGNENNEWGEIQGERTSSTDNLGNASSYVANAESRESREQEARNRGQGSLGGSEEVSDDSNTNDKGQQGRTQQIQIRQELFCGAEHTWAAEPDVGRVANGIPFRVDRIKCLGNAVVPQCAEVFARAIKEKEGLI